MNDSLSQIWNCPEVFEFICTKKWDRLTPTDVENIRHCDVCYEGVYWSDNPQEFVANAKLGRCVAVPTQAMPFFDKGLAGRVSPEYLRDKAEHQARSQLWRSNWQLILSQDPVFILFLIRQNYPDTLGLFIDLVTNNSIEQELLEQAYELLSRSIERDKFILYLLKIGEIDRAIEIAISGNLSSYSLRIIYGSILQMNLVAEAMQILSSIDRTSREYSLSVYDLGEKMAELGQAKQAIDSYENYLQESNDRWPDIQTNISNRLPDLYLLDRFIHLDESCYIVDDLVDRSGELFPADADRKKFALYLLKNGKFERAIAIANTIDGDTHLLNYIEAVRAQALKSV